MKALTLPVLVLLMAAPAWALPTYLNTPNPSCSGWAATHQACAAVTFAGEHGKIADPFGSITALLVAPEAPGSTRVPKGTVWFKAAYTRVHVQARWDAMTGAYNPIVPENTYGSLVSPASAAALATVDITVNAANRHLYCTLTKCVVPLNLTAQQVQAVTDWEAAGAQVSNTGYPYNTHPVSVDVVAHAWLDDPNGDLSKRHEVFEATLDPPTIPTGCEIGPPGPPALALAALLGVLLLVAWRRRMLLALALLLVCAGVAHAANILAVGDANLATLQAAAANDTLGAVIPTMQFASGIPPTAQTANGGGVPPTLQNGATVATAQQVAGGCVLPTITYAATTDVGPEMVPRGDYLLVVDADCTVSIAYPATDAQDGPLIAPAVTAQMGTRTLSSNYPYIQCARPYKMSISTYDLATLSLYGAPWPFVGSTPSWWAAYTRLPATQLQISGSVMDYGDPPPDSGGGGLDLPEPFGHTASAFGFVGWTVEPGPPGLPAIPPNMNSASPQVYYNQSLQYFSLRDTSIGEVMFPQPSGFWHEMNLAMWERPAGRIDMLAAATGVLPNWGFGISSIPPRIPAVFAILGSTIAYLNGVCPFDILYPFVEGSCGQNCYVYTDYPQ